MKFEQNENNKKHLIYNSRNLLMKFELHPDRKYYLSTTVEIY